MFCVMVLVEVFVFKDIFFNVDFDGGCFCNFEFLEMSIGIMIFVSDMGKNVVIKVNG